VFSLSRPKVVFSAQRFHVFRGVLRRVENLSPPQLLARVAYCFQRRLFFGFITRISQNVVGGFFNQIWGIDRYMDRRRAA